MNVQLLETADPRTASQWFAVRRSAHNEELERRFLAWLAASAENFEAYALCELTWELCASAALGMSVSPVAMPWYRRTLVRAAAAAIFVLAIGAVTFAWVFRPVTTVWSTKPGEQLAMTLEDGSLVTLNTRSRLEVRMSRSRRHVRLLEGEAYFAVAHDPDRPFDVDTRFGSVRALGTRFDLLLDERHLEVNMEEGKVLVSSGTGGGQEAVAGIRATLMAGDARATLDSADLNRLENWRAQRIEFDRVALEEVLKEMSRYTRVPIRAGSGQIGGVMISAVLKTGDVEALKATLKGAFGFRVVEGDGEFVVVDGGS